MFWCESCSGFPPPPLTWEVQLRLGNGCCRTSTDKEGGAKTNCTCISRPHSDVLKQRHFQQTLGPETQEDLWVLVVTLHESLKMPTLSLWSCHIISFKSITAVEDYLQNPLEFRFLLRNALQIPQHYHLRSRLLPSHWQLQPQNFRFSLEVHPRIKDNHFSWMTSVITCEKWRCTKHSLNKRCLGF